MRRYKIGEVSKMVDVPVETIRFLEQKGLVRPEKNKENGYRYYSIWDVNQILDYKKFRQIGFSSKETVEFVRGRTLPDLLEELEKKRQDAAYLSQYYQAKAIKLKNFQSMLSSVHDMVGEYLIMNLPENYSLFTRTRSETSNRVISAKETEGVFHELTGQYPFVEHIYRIKQKDLYLPDRQETAEWGFTIKKYWAERLGVQLITKMEHIRSATALFTIIPLGEQEYFSRAVLNDVLSFMKEHNYEINGDILGVYIATIHEEERNVRYLELWVPIREGVATAHEPSGEKIARIKRIFA